MCDPMTALAAGGGLLASTLLNKPVAAPAPAPAAAAPTASITPPSPNTAETTKAVDDAVSNGATGVSGVTLDDAAVQTTPLGVTKKAKVKKVTLGGVPAPASSAMTV